MSTQPLTSYLRAFRKRSGLSQDDVGFLLGSMEGYSISRHEAGARLPTLKIALGYGHIFRANIAEIYEGVLYEVRAEIREKARTLRRSLLRKPNTPHRERKMALLAELIDEQA